MECVLSAQGQPGAREQEERLEGKEAEGEAGGQRGVQVKQDLGFDSERNRELCRVLSKRVTWFVLCIKKITVYFFVNKHLSKSLPQVRAYVKSPYL